MILGVPQTMHGELYWSAGASDGGWVRLYQGDSHNGNYCSIRIRFGFGKILEFVVVWVALLVNDNIRERERERDRETERDRQRDRETERDRERQRQRQTETDRDRDRETYRKYTPCIDRVYSSLSSIINVKVHND